MTIRQVRILQEMRKQAHERRNWDFTYQEFTTVCVAAGVIEASQNENTRRSTASRMRQQLANRKAVLIDGSAETVRLL